MTYNKDINEHRERNRKYQHEWYLRNKKVQVERSRKQKEKNRAVARSYTRNMKETTPCADCGQTYPYYVMDFDHMDNKEFLISRAVADGSMSLSRIKIEIDKCEIVCSNCHRIRTFERR